MSVHNPHDRFFRESFSRPEIARNYLEEYLPTDLLGRIDLDTLDLQEGTFIDESLREQQSDLLYQTRLKDDGRICWTSTTNSATSPTDPAKKSREKSGCGCA
jgi:hypothetical protein